MKLGLLLGHGTLPLVERYQDALFHLDTTSAKMAKEHYPDYPHVQIRTAISTSLDGIQELVGKLGEDSAVTHVGYNPERRDCTPESEWRNLVSSIATADELADTHGFALLYGPGMRLALANYNLWPTLRMYTGAWYMQCQIFQGGDVAAFRAEVRDHVRYLRKGRSLRSAEARFRGPIIAQVSLTGCFPAEVYAYVRALRGIVSAVRLLHMRDLDKLAEVLALLYPAL